MPGVLLDSIQFVDREVPDVIHWGGKHMLALHKQLGGTRVIDAMGPDPIPIKWAGRFQGTTASVRARMVDTLKDSGKQVALSWGTFNYTVVVAEFDATYKHEFEVTYEITCEVVQGLLTASATPNIQSVISGDLATAALSAEQMTATAQGAITTAQNALAAVAAQSGGLANASLASMQSLIASAQAAYSAVSGTVTSPPSGISLDAISGASALDGIATFTTEQAAVATESDANIALGYIGRAVSNLQLAGG
jgi:hypothetical protein